MAKKEKKETTVGFRPSGIGTRFQQAEKEGKGITPGAHPEREDLGGMAKRTMRDAGRAIKRGATKLFTGLIPGESESSIKARGQKAGYDAITARNVAKYHIGEDIEEKVIREANEAKARARATRDSTARARTNSSGSYRSPSTRRDRG